MDEIKRSSIPIYIYYMGTGQSPLGAFYSEDDARECAIAEFGDHNPHIHRVYLYKKEGK